VPEEDQIISSYGLENEVEEEEDEQLEEAMNYRSTTF
jgi:hypothetical protein